MDPNQTISPSVMTSRAATADLARIQGLHSNIVQGISNQAVKVAEYQNSVRAEGQQQAAMRMDQEKLKADQESKKLELGTRLQEKKMDFDQKQAELELKKIALTNG